MSQLNMKIRMYCIATLAVLVISGVVAYRGIIVTKGELMQQQAQYQKSIVQNLIKTVSLLMVHEDSLRITAVMKKLPALEQNLHLAILNESGEVMHSSEQVEVGIKQSEVPKISDWDSSGSHQERIHRNSLDYFQVVKRISNLPECQRCHGLAPTIGYLVATLDITWIEKGEC